MEDEEEDEMPKANDRKRVKDRIIEGIAKAVKHIQSYQLSQSLGEEQSVVLKNSDWQFHKLVENLDHAFLYGLRHFSSGYWIVVQEFTHKSTIEDIVKMSNIVTNLGRSRAWLYLALSDHLLESYIHCFMKNAELLQQHYVKEALVLDEQRLGLLLTLSSGLELIAFDLEVDVPYLDLCSCLKFRSENQEEEAEDNISLCSMISLQSQSSVMEETNRSRAMISPLSLLSNLMKPLSFKLQPTTSSLTLEETEEEKKLRIESFASTEVPPVVLPIDDSVAEASVNGEVEVIHVKPKRHHARRRDHLQKSPSAPESDNSSLVSVDSSACLVLSPISSESSGYQTVQEDSGCNPCVDASSNIPSSNTDNSSETVIKTDNLQGVVSSPDKRPDEVKCLTNDVLSQDEKLLRILEDHCDAMPVEKVCLNDILEWKSCTEFSSDQRNKLSPEKLSPSLDPADFNSLSSPSQICERSCVNNCKAGKPEVETPLETSDPVILAPVEEPSIYDDNARHSEVAGDATKDPDDSPSNAVVFASSVESAVAENQNSHPSIDPVPLSDNDASLMLTETDSLEQTDCYLKMSHSSEIKVDNNLKVVLMLDVFLHDEENLFKMFRTCQGHTEGEILVTYVVITSHYLYLLRPSNQHNKFTREVAITYKELDYISISLNYQVLHIACRARHNQFWITTGDEVLTRIIVAHLKRAVATSAPDGSHGSSVSSLMILEDATAQKISIAKLVSEETNISREAVSLLNYSLVHWEDSEAIGSGDLRLDHSHQGVLYYKTYTAAYLFAAAVWLRGYFVLEQGVLHQYSDKNCSGTPVKSISLAPNQCRGCRRCSASDRNHVFEILLPHGSNSIELAASSEAELQEWLVRLCQATCNQSNPRASVFGCVACCSVVTQSHVFMCHEDLQTNFLRSLACLPLSSLSQIQTDANSPTYCVLAFRRKSKTMNGEEVWCLYFNSTAERDKFIGSVLDACTQFKQSALGMVPVESRMSKRCQAGIAKLDQLFKVGAV